MTVLKTQTSVNSVFAEETTLRAQAGHKGHKPQLRRYTRSSWKQKKQAKNMRSFRATKDCYTRNNQMMEIAEETPLHNFWTGKTKSYRMPSKDFKPITKKAWHLTQEKVSVLFYSYPRKSKCIILFLPLSHCITPNFLSSKLHPSCHSELVSSLHCYQMFQRQYVTLKVIFSPNTVVVRMCFQLILISS